MGGFDSGLRKVEDALGGVSEAGVGREVAPFVDIAAALSLG